MLNKEIDPYEMFWLPHAIAFCKMMDEVEIIKKFNKRNLSGLFRKIIDYVEESHLLLIKYLSRKYYLLETDKRANIISSCIVYVSEIWLREAARMFSWMCIRYKIPDEMLNGAQDSVMTNFNMTCCIEPYLEEFNNCWKWVIEEDEE